MPWSKDTATAKGILRKDSTAKRVLEFTPPRFDLGTPTQAMNYLTAKKVGSDFVMNDSIRVQTGVDKIEQASVEEKIEVAALEKLKEIQESAYSEAYALGLEEGRADAFAKVSAEIQSRMTNLDELLLSITRLKKDLQGFNEAHLVKLVFQMATRLAKHEVQTNPDSVIQVLKDAVSLSQDEENITVRVSTEQFDFLEELKKQTSREFDFLKKIRFEPSEEITSGGCIVETNYGEVDARIEQRIEQLWSTVSEHIPKVKNKIAS